MPAVKNDVAHSADPEASVTDEQPLMAAPFEVKPSVPVGKDPDTAAVNVTAWPTVDGFRLETKTVVVVAPLTTCDRPALLGPCVLSPEKLATIEFVPAGRLEVEQIACRNVI